MGKRSTSKAKDGSAAKYVKRDSGGSIVHSEKQGGFSSKGSDETGVKKKGEGGSTGSPRIVRTDGIRGGRPRITGRRITVDDIVIMHLRIGQTIEEIAARYSLSLADVHAALAHYYDHKAEIDHLIERDTAFVEAFKRNNPSKLQERLKALRDG